MNYAHNSTRLCTGVMILIALNQLEVAAQILLKWFEDNDVKSYPNKYEALRWQLWWWLAHPALLRHVIHLVYFLFKAANFQIRHLLTFWWRFLRHSGPVRLSAYIRPMITWYLFFNLIGHWSCDMWPHLAQWWCPHFNWTSVACGFPLNQTIDQRLFYRQIFLWEFDGLRTCTLSCLCAVQSCVT